MATLRTNESPRFENGAWKWYEKNTFSLSFNIKIPQDQFATGDTPANYTYEVAFHKANGDDVHKFNITVSAEGITVIPVTATEPAKYSFNLVCAFTSAVTKKFLWGEYTYCIKMKKTNVTHTLYANGIAEVELCH